MTTIRKKLTLAATALAIGAGVFSIGTAVPAEAGGKRHFHVHVHKGHFHKWHGHRFHNRHFYVYNACYWKWTAYGKVKVCPYGYYY